MGLFGGLGIVGRIGLFWWLGLLGGSVHQARWAVARARWAAQIRLTDSAGLALACSVALAAPASGKFDCRAGHVFVIGLLARPLTVFSAFHHET